MRFPFFVDSLSMENYVLALFVLQVLYSIWQCRISIAAKTHASAAIACVDVGVLCDQQLRGIQVTDRASQVERSTRVVISGIDVASCK